MRGKRWGVIGKENGPFVYFQQGRKGKLSINCLAY